LTPPKKPYGEPVICPKCGASAANRPGMRIERGLPEAVFTDDGGVAVEVIRCLSCQSTWPVAAGSVRVIKATR
jgi:hypothetical protein